MKEIIYNRAKTCCVTGHRNMTENPDIEKLKKTFIEIINDGYDTFLIGMALGFDTVCFNILQDLREKFNIKIIACIPFLGQPNRFTEAQRKEYYNMINSADDSVCFNENYTPYCMQQRNRYMVDNSCLIVVYLRRNFGGTYFTYNYAKKNNLKIINV